jgi:hypothetical protein
MRSRASSGDRLFSAYPIRSAVSWWYGKGAVSRAPGSRSPSLWGILPRIACIQLDVTGSAPTQLFSCATVCSRRKCCELLRLGSSSGYRLLEVNVTATAEEMKLKVVLLSPLEWGGFLPTLPLARSMSDCGWFVSYVGFWQKGPTSTFESQDAIPNVIAMERFPFINLADGMQPTTTPADVVNILAERLSGEATNLILCQDSMSMLAQAVGNRLRIPVVTLYTHFGDFFNWRCPPISSTCIPGNSFIGRCRILWEWAVAFLSRGHRWRYVKHSSFGSPLGFNGFTWVGKTREEIVLGPRSFEYPTTRPRRYFGSHLAPEIGPVAEIEWAWPNCGTTRIYVTIGEYSHRYKLGKEFLRRVIALAKSREDLTLILQIGKLDVSEITAEASCSALPRNVHAYKWVPQCETLKQADLAIIHGGFGTIKECIACQTPMIVVPFAFDQYGNAARVKFHSLGLIADAKSADESELSRLIDAVLGDGCFVCGLKTMKRRVELERKREGSDTIQYLKNVAHGIPMSRPD